MNYVANPQPINTFTDAIERIDALIAQEADKLNPSCQTRLLSHRHKTERVIVLIHGFTSCPQQYCDLSKLFFEQGHNVLLGRLPHHGLADRLTNDLANLTAEELAEFIDEMIDVAHGLGNHVTIAGISGGGVTVAWAAQHRNDIDRAVIMSPAFGFGAISTPLTRLAMMITLWLPNSFNWWDKELKEQGSPPHFYPRYSTHALAQILRLGFEVQDAARRVKPAAKSILVITNANDHDVNNVLTQEVVGNWRVHDVEVDTYEFEVKLKLDHDFIDPVFPHQRTDVVYPQLLELIR